MTRPTVKHIIQGLPDGYSEVRYEHSRYGMTVERFNDGRSFKIYARQLGGNDKISLNFYSSSSGDHLRPCEMPEEKVTRFLRNHRPIR